MKMVCTLLTTNGFQAVNQRPHFALRKNRIIPSLGIPSLEREETPKDPKGWAPREAIAAPALAPAVALKIMTVLTSVTS